jgi:hypothetical protein
MGVRVRLETAVETAANAAQRWRSQYENWSDHDRFSDGITKEQVNGALNSHRHTPENIAAILNPGWAYPQCGACGDRYEAIAVFAVEYGDAITVCIHCAQRAADLLLGHGQNKRIENGHRTGSAMLKAAD